MKLTIPVTLITLSSVTILTFFVHRQIKRYMTREQYAQQFMEDVNRKSQEDAHRLSIVEWKFDTNLTDENLKIKVDVEADVAKRSKEIWKEVIKYPWQNFKNSSLQRQFRSCSYLGTAALSDDKFLNLTNIINTMVSIYSKAKICPQDSKPGDICKLSLDPELRDILATSQDPEELKHVWVKWRDAVGPKCRSLFKEYVDLSNEAAKLNKMQDMSELWLKDLEQPDIKNIVDNLWQQLRPLYLQLHAYIRRKLKEKYGDIVSEREPIPAHLLGDMWGQNWANIANFSLPYSDVKDDTDLTEKLKNKNFTVLKIFKTAEDFYISINMSKMPETFWNDSQLVKPSNTESVCQAQAWDFSNRKDFRILACTEVTGKDFVMAHHEMGHIEYFIQYKDQPFLFRGGANDGFHEAIGDLIALSVQSTKHLKKIGLQDNKTDDRKAVLNNLFRLGLFQVAFLPFSYLTDLWRWDVFSGKTKFEDYNCDWWKLKEKYQGIEPPIDRSEDDFDPAAKYHIVGDVPYLRYFVSMILQYQFHKSLCKVAGEYEENNPEKLLHECDIYGHVEAGNLLKKMLAMGSSRPWPDALEVITGQREMDASGILEYFKPLQIWLENENTKHNTFVGWEPSKKVCTRKRN